MELVFAALTAVVWSHESLTYSVEFGAFLILFGMVLAEWPTQPKKRRIQPIQEK
jgi:drug/metabolite transporter (DMT)-like permease